jgi:hypothetical protein
MSGCQKRALLIAWIVSLTLAVSVAAENRVIAWGANSAGQINAPTNLTDVVFVSGGAYHSLALCSNGTVVVWGDNTYGQANVPANATNVAAISAGWFHDLALRSNGTVVAWGDNTYGQTNVPVLATNVVAVAGGWLHSLALRSDGTVVCWGDNGWGQTNVPDGLDDVAAIAAGQTHSLALRRNRTIICWGDSTNAFGLTNIPPGLTGVVAIVGTVVHSLALKADGTVVAWGCNNFGQTNTPFGLSNVIAIAAGGEHSLVSEIDGTVVAWGNDDWGQTDVPAGVTNVVAISAGHYHNLALVRNGSPVLTVQPFSQTVNMGGTVTLWVMAFGNGPLSYQWRKADNAISGATNSSYRIASVVAGDAGSYDVVVTNAYGSATSAVAVLTIDCPTITLSPATLPNGNFGVSYNQTIAATGGVVPYIYATSGSLPNGLVLATNGVLTGSALAFSTNTFTVIATDAYGCTGSTNYTLAITPSGNVLDTNNPAVTISSPANKATVTTASITVSGTAKDITGSPNTGVALVLYSVNDGPQQLADTTNQYAKWTANVTLIPGTNTFTVQSVDFRGNASSVITNRYFFKVLWPLTVVTNGNGKVSIPNGSSLILTKNYTITATPRANTLFTNWAESVNGGPTNVVFSNTKYPFQMQSNLTLIANFATNRYLNAAGNYYGLFYESETNVTHQSAGFFKATVTSPSSKPPTFSGKLSVEGQTHRFSGSLDVEGNGTSKPVTRENKTSLTVQLHLPADDTVSGSVSNNDGSWVSELTGNRSVFKTTTNPATNYAGSYTLVLPEPTNGIPGGDGYATVKVAGSGKITVSGSLGDAQALKPSATVVSKAGDWAFYAPAYPWTNGSGDKQYAGEIMGWLAISNDTPKHIVGDLNWIKTGWTNGYYDGGFSNIIEVLGGSYTPDANRVVAITNGVAILSGGNLAADYTNSFVLNPGNKFVITNTPYGQLYGNSLKVTPMPQTGLMRVSFRNPCNTNVTTMANGVVLQDDKTAHGVLKGLTNESGSLFLQGN